MTKLLDGGDDVHRLEGEVHNIADEEGKHDCNDDEQRQGARFHVARPEHDSEKQEAEDDHEQRVEAECRCHVHVQ